MNINRNNCESFFLDYYEKNLSPVEVAEVLFFLEENPDLKSTFESYQAVYLGEPQEIFLGKATLKKEYGAEELDRILSSEITKHNCEQFFVALAENLLSEDQVAKLQTFLSANPEFKKDLDLVQRCKLPIEQTSFDQKDLLKKELVNAENREEYFVRAIDNDLNASEQKELASFLKRNPTYNKEYELFSRTILPADKITFEFKRDLKKKERKPVVIALWSQRSTYYAAAAAILLLAGLFLFFRSNDNHATYFADRTNTHVEPAQVTPSAPAKGQVSSIPGNANENSSRVEKGKKNISAGKKSATPESESKGQSAPQLVQPITNTEKTFLAKKPEDKKSEEAQIEAPFVAVNTMGKKDSLSSEAIAKSDTAVAAPVANQAMASNVNAQAKTDEYKTFAAVVNKKLKSMLGMEKANECNSEISDKKINLWDLAMVAKNGIQNAIGTKAVDVSKVCDGTGDKVEYVFTAGNFQITKSSPK